MSDPRVQPTSAKRRWAFRLIALLGMPLALLLALNGALALLDYGFDPDYLRRDDSGSQVLLRDNPEFFRLFFPEHLLPAQLPFALESPKPAGRVRVVLLGGSAAMGIPEPAYGMGPMLEALLRERHPGVDFEVLNLGNTAINSHVVREIAAQLEPLQPDLFVVYLGNNEVVGPFGAGTVFTPLAPGSRTIRASIALQRTRVGQLLRNLGSRFSEREQPTSWQGMEMFLEQQVPANHPRLERVYDNFEENLGAICDTAQELGIPVVLSTVGTNLRHCGPFASVDSQRRGEANAREFASAVAEGDSALQRAALDEALAHYERALALDEESADMHFRVGRLQLTQDRVEEARENLLMARELDTLRFRAGVRIHERIERVARERRDRGVRLAAVVDSLEAVAPAGLPGRESFWEHVHFGFRGNLRVAYALLPAVEASLGSNLAARRRAEVRPGTEEVANALGYTPWHQRTLTQQMGRMLSRPPFTYQIDHAEQMHRLQNDFERLQEAYSLEAVAEMWPTVEQAMHRRPDDWIRRYRAADFLVEALGRPREAEPLWRSLVEEFPEFPAAINALAKCVSQQQRPDESMQLLERSLEIDPYQVDMLANLGRMKTNAGDIEAAKRLLRRALALEPDNMSVEYTLQKLEEGALSDAEPRAPEGSGSSE